MLKRIRNLWVPILAQITVPYILLAIIIAILGTIVITRIAFDTVEERFTNQLLESGILVGESLVRQQNDLLDTQRVVAHTQGMAEAISEPNRRAMAELLLPIAYSSGAEVLALMDTSGSVLLQFHRRESEYRREPATGYPYQESAAVQMVLGEQVDEAGDKFVGLVEVDGVSYLFIVGPVREPEGQLVGAALVGQSLERLSALIREETLAHFTLYDAQGEPVGTTLQSPQKIASGPLNEAFNDSAEGSVLREIESEGIQYAEVLSGWDLRAGQPPVVVGAALPVSFLAKVTLLTRSNTLMVLFAYFAMVLVVGLLISRRISQPILSLRDAAERIASGDDDVHVDEGSRSEIGVLERAFNAMALNVRHSKQELLDAYDRTIEGWALALDLRDQQTQGHSRRVALLTEAFAKELGFNEQELQHIRRGALLHDVGKIATPDAILLKPDRLDEAEILIMQEHPLHAKNFMGDIEFLKPAMDIPVYHHEKWDGSGYPFGLKGEEIPLPARIFAIVDAWDALTHDRPYHGAAPHEEAMQIIQEASGTHFDPNLVPTFLELLPKLLERIGDSGQS